MIKKQATSFVNPVKSWAKKLGTAFILGKLFAFVGYSLCRDEHQPGVQIHCWSNILSCLNRLLL